MRTTRSLAFFAALSLTASLPPGLSETPPPTDVEGEFRLFGTGCPGSTGIPILFPENNSRPRVGKTFKLRLENLPVSTISIPFGVLGLSKTSWEGLSLPLDLGQFGLTGCTQYASADFSYILENESGVASWHIRVPNRGILLGLEFYVQSLVLDFGANFANAVVSNAGEGLIGNR